MWQLIANLWNDLTIDLFGYGSNSSLGDGDSWKIVLEDIFSTPQSTFYWLGIFATIIILVVLGFALFKWAFSFVFKCFKLD